MKSLVIPTIAALALSACSTTPKEVVREVTVTREIPVPYHQPCPASDKPVVPKRVADEHPVMPADGAARERILAAKVLELFGYAMQADAVMTECGRPR